VLTLQKYLHQLKAKGAQTIAMEVSSHGLSQNRANSVHFESAIFTNLTQDHLDYHLTMQAYGQAKQKLFQFPELRQAIINADCPYGQTIADSVPKRVPVILYSAKEQVRELTLDRNGICAHIKTGWGNGTLRSPLLGEFNVSNLLAVLTQLCARDIPFAQALEALALAQAAPGRMQAIKAAHSPQVIIDYAHTPDALEKALIGARAHAMGRVWCVFGCGGDRDKSKRAAMGAAAMAYADHIIITNDNPRTEDPQQIIQHILDGVNIAQQAKVIVEPDRAKAIELAVTTADVNDTVLVAGKGHEDYQIIGEQKFPFSDQQTVNTILRGEAA
jgi:UDP-N-acetylmuramoyl-L-alanyl-D-glutamate--2,6-diaminopimelate ligase